MARTPKKLKTGTSATVRGQSSDPLSRLGLYYPILVNCRLRRRPAPDGLEKEKAERFYDCTVNNPAAHDADDIGAAICEFSAGLRINEERTLEITATYLVGFKAQGATPNAEKHLVEQMIESSAWPMYRGLFIHVGSQSGAELPLLPNIPKIRWLTKEETKGAKTKIA